jgi:hypothetical protein
MLQRTLTFIATPLTVALLCLILAPGSMQAWAQGRGASSANAAAALVKSKSDVRVLGVRTHGQGARTSYRVKVITPKGVVRVVTVPHRQR